MDERLKVLFEYTKFHIGIYITLGGILLAAMLENRDVFNEPYHWIFLVSLLALLLSGMAGGVIASHIPHHTKFSEFESEQIGVRIMGIGKSGLYERWSRLEHRSFWVAILVLVLGSAGVRICCDSISFESEISSAGLRHNEVVAKLLRQSSERTDVQFLENQIGELEAGRVITDSEKRDLLAIIGVLFSEHSFDRKISQLKEIEESYFEKATSPAARIITNIALESLRRNSTKGESSKPKSTVMHVVTADMTGAIVGAKKGFELAEKVKRKFPKIKGLESILMVIGGVAGGATGSFEAVREEEKKS